MLICHVKHDIYFQEISSCSIHAFGVSKMNIRSRLFLNRHSFSKKKNQKNIYYHKQEGVQVRNYGNTMPTESYELNPDHSHFLILDELSRDLPQDTLRCMIEKQFSVKQGSRKLKKLMSVG